MATYMDADGNVLTKAELAAKTQQTTPDRVFTEPVFQAFTHEGAKYESAKRVVFVPGSRLTQDQFDALFATATVTDVDPAEGDIAGGDVVTITGTNLGGVEAVTFGGVEGTGLKRLSDEQVQVTTPAGEAGAVDVVVADDSGNVTVEGGFTYVDPEA